MYIICDEFIVLAMWLHVFLFCSNNYNIKIMFGMNSYFNSYCIIEIPPITTQDQPTSKVIPNIHSVFLYFIKVIAVSTPRFRFWLVLKLAKTTWQWLGVYIYDGGAVLTSGTSGFPAKLLLLISVVTQHIITRSMVNEH